MVLAVLIGIIFLHILIYSVPPIIGSLMGEHEQVYLNYIYLGTLFTLVQVFDSLYAIKLNDQFSLNGGDIAYSALLFATMYLISSQPEPKIVRNMIYSFIVIAAFLFLLFGLIAPILSSEYIDNYLNITEVLLQFSFESLLLSLILFVGEVILILTIIQFLSNKFSNERLMTLNITFAYEAVLLLDGILYPIGINLLFDSNLSIVNGIIAKLVFGMGFGTLLVVLLLVRPNNFSELIRNKRPILWYIVPPGPIKLEEQLIEAEGRIEELKKIIPICASCKKIRDDLGYWNQLELFMKVHKDIQFSHGYCPDCADKLMPS